MQLTPTVYGPDNQVSYFISDPDLAKVDANGLVTAKKAGFATVTATATGSDITNPATASLSFFIEPAYFARMADSVGKYDLSNGLTVGGSISLCLAPGETDEASDKSAMQFPYSISILKDETSGFMMDAHLDLGANTAFISSYLMIAGIDAGLAASTRFGFTYYGGSSLFAYGMNGADNDALCYYRELSLADDVAPFLLTKVISLVSSQTGSSLITEDFIYDILNNGLEALDLSSYGGLINTVLYYDSDPTVGIYAYKNHLATVQTYVDKLKEKAQESEIGAMLALMGFFPESLQDIRLTFDMKEDGSFFKINFIIKDKKNDAVYKYFTVSYGQEAYNDSYLSKVKASLDLGAKEQEYLNAALVLKEKVRTDLLNAPLIGTSVSSVSSHSAYDAIHFSSEFVKDLKSYRAAADALDDQTSSTYVSNQTWKSNANLKEFLPYASFKVSNLSDTAQNALPEKYEAVSGSQFLLSGFAAAGSNAEDTAIADADMSFTFSCKYKAASGEAYYTYDQTTHILTINALPAKDDILKITSKSGSNKNLVYQLSVKAAVA